MTVQDVQKQIFEEINDPKNQIHLRVQKKTLDRDEYLGSIKKRCEKDGLSEEETEDIVYLVDKSLWGFGIIDDLIMDPDISDIRLMDENHVRIKRLGKRYPANVKFNSKEEYEKYIDFITSRNNTNMSVVNAAQVFTDKDSCPTDILRFSLVSDLVNTGDRPTLLIRKIPKEKRSIEKLEQYGLFTPEQYAYLKKRWQDGHGLLVCGPNGSGKTTLTNQVLEETPHNKSAVIIQESEELFCNSHPEMVFRKVIPQKNGSAVSYALKDLARLALMESFDIIVVGEIKGDEAAELSYATYTGSQTMTTVHSNSAIEGYEKLIDYALDAQPNRTREHFAKQFKSLDTVVYVESFKCKEIYELGGYDNVTQQYTFKEISFDKDTESNAIDVESKINDVAENTTPVKENPIADEKIEVPVQVAEEPIQKPVQNCVPKQDHIKPVPSNRQEDVQQNKTNNCNDGNGYRNNSGNPNGQNNNGKNNPNNQNKQNHQNQNWNRKQNDNKMVRNENRQNAPKPFVQPANNNDGKSESSRESIRKNESGERRFHNNENSAVRPKEFNQHNHNNENRSYQNMNEDVQKNYVDENRFINKEEKSVVNNSTNNRDHWKETDNNNNDHNSDRDILRHPNKEEIPSYQGKPQTSPNASNEDEEFDLMSSINSIAQFNKNASGQTDEESNDDLY